MQKACVRFFSLHTYDCNFAKELPIFVTEIEVQTVLMCTTSYISESGDTKSKTHSVVIRKVIRPFSFLKNARLPRPF